MATNSGQIDLNADAVSFDRENEVIGFNLTESNVGVVESINNEVKVRGQEFCQVGEGRESNGSVEPLSGSVVGGLDRNPGCNVMICGSGQEGFGEETEIVYRANDVEAGAEIVDGGCHVKAAYFSNGLLKDEGNESLIERPDGDLVVDGGTETDKCLVFELNDGVQNELDCENVSQATENGSTSIKVELNREAQGGDNLTVCHAEDRNGQKFLADEAANQGAGVLANFSAVVGDENKIKDAGNMISKDGLEDSCVSGVAESTCQLLDAFPHMEIKDVDIKESLHHKVRISRNHICQVETSNVLKQPSLEVGGQTEVIQNRTIDINITEAMPSENIQNKCHGFNVVADLNPYRNLPEVDFNRRSVSSELNLCVSDLVWGKVRGHPWWPGQIFDPSAASEKAKRHFKKDSYLIAYFGDQTFAWNDASKIKPFQMYFSQMEKQRNLENFHHAVDCAIDEVSRRVEFGLSCPCMPEEVFMKLKTQIIINAGINKHSSRRDGGDRFLNAVTFEPINLVNFVKLLALSPHTESDRLDFAIARAQLLAFSRSKGYSQLPEFIMFDGLFKNDMEILLMGKKEIYDYEIDRQGLKTDIGLSHKRKHISGDCMKPSKKQKRLSDLMSDKCLCIPNDEHLLKRKASDKLVLHTSGRKRKVPEDTCDDYYKKFQNRKLIQLQYVSVDEMWSQLCLAATQPIREGCLSDMVYFFAEFRNFITLDDSASLEQEMSVEQMHAGENAVRSMEAVASGTSTVELCKDSYWTDRIIQCIPEKQSLLKNQNEREEFLSVTPTDKGSPQAAAEININLQDADGNLRFDPSKLEKHFDESSEEDICPTALILEFTNLDSVPSETNLNKIFGRFGPLIESQTELLKKSNCARVVFKRRSHAETAFSSAGKYSIFGPSLLRYHLKVMPPSSLKKTTVSAGKRRRKGTSAGEGAAV